MYLPSPAESQHGCTEKEGERPLSKVYLYGYDKGTDMTHANICDSNAQTENRSAKLQQVGHRTLRLRASVVLHLHTLSASAAPIYTKVQDAAFLNTKE